MRIRGVLGLVLLPVALSLVTIAFGVGCGGSDEADATESSALSCVPNQDAVCLCGLNEGVQKCSKSGKLGKCECSGSSNNDQGDKAAEEEGSKPGTSSSDTSGSSSGSSSGTSSTSSSTSSGTSGNTTPKKDPPTACTDVADAVAAAAQRCGQDAQTERKGFIDAAAGGSCSNITSIRDMSALYATCIPWFKTATCSTLLSGSIDPSCQGQLLR